MSNEVDIRENDILQRDPVLLDTLLIDRSRPKNGSKHSPHIIWATDNYESLGPEYGENEQISIASITGDHGSLIQPRVKKTREEQQARARDKGEVFTPAWICNKQNNLVDNEWFGAAGLFNEETETGWNTNPAPIPFPTKDGKPDYERRKALREEKAYPEIKKFETWMEENLLKCPPKSLMEKAISYTYNILKKLSLYVTDGRYKIDDNMVENSIRPLAIGRLCSVQHKRPYVGNAVMLAS